MSSFLLQYIKIDKNVRFLDWCNCYFLFVQTNRKHKSMRFIESVRATLAGKRDIIIYKNDLKQTRTCTTLKAMLQWWTIGIGSIKF